MRWRSTSAARSRTSSPVTWPRPRSSASTCAARARPIGPRGLAPNSISARRGRRGRARAGCGSRRRGRPRRRSRRGRRAPSARAPAKRCRSASETTSRTAAGSARLRPTTAASSLGRRVVDEDLHQEAVDLRLRQRVGALGLDRVLRRHREERPRHRVGGAADRHLVLLHHLEQRRLDLRRRAVDLVGEQEVCEHRPELGVEASPCRGGRCACRRGRPARGRA